MSGKKRKSLLVISAFVLISLSLAAALLWERAASAYLTFYPYVEAPPKNSVALDDNEQVRGGAERANVLFVLDTGSAMTFTPTGTMPEWGVNVNTPANAAAMLRQATYGHGGLNVVGTASTNNNSADRRSRMGREGLDEDDEKNNAKPGDWNLNNHLNDYYSPFNYPNNMPALDLGISGAPAIPYALMFKNQAYWTNGPGGSFTKDDLVPNDSRMYKMKLVMWRVLEDAVMLEKLRIGMATTFQEFNGPNMNYIADFYKFGGFGAFGTTFTYGTGPGWATGLANGSGSGQGYYQSASAYWGIDRDYYDILPTDAKYGFQWKLLNRAYLRVPIAEYSQEHANMFRLWIDGYENITMTINDNTSPYYFRNPELIGDGKTYLSTAIYPGHPDLSRATLNSTRDVLNKPGIVFSNRTSSTTASLHIDSASGLPMTEGTMQTTSAMGNYFKAGSGEALGTILDFFTPPVSEIGGVGFDAYNVRSAPDVSFPLRNPCEKNWVILFTAADDSGDVGFTSAEAVKKLYEFTRDNTLTRYAGTNADGTNKFEGINLQDGVRTLVVGFVDPNSNAPNVRELRDKLTAIAIAGDPGNPHARAYFANDVEGLLQSLRMILARINSDIQPSKGSMLEGPGLGDETLVSDDADSLNFYATNFRINIYDQWEGSLTRYETTKNKENGQLETAKKWEFGSSITARRDATPGSRNLMYWAGNNGRNFQKVEYTGSAEFSGAHSNVAAARTRHPLAALSANDLNFTPVSDSRAHDTGNSANAAEIDNIMETITVGNDHTFFQKVHPSRAFADWFYGYEVSYSNRKPDGNREMRHFKRRNMLADPGNSGVSIVGPVAVEDTLPGFKAFAQGRQDVASKLYFQTNEGLLHVVNAMSGTEDMAILPPPSLLPHRLWSLKTIRIPAPGQHTFLKDSYINVDWQQGQGQGSWKSGRWNLGGMTLEAAVNHLNNDSADIGDTPEGTTIRVFAIVYAGGNKAYITLTAGNRNFRVSGPAAIEMGMNNMVVPTGTTGSGNAQLDYPRTDRYRWIDVQDFMTVTSDDIPISSIPSFTLDGPLQIRYFDFGGVAHNWRAFMLATLGRGGGGIYAMDVTDPANPEYLWYHETLEGADKDPAKLRIFHQTNRSVYSRIEPRFRDVTRGAGYWDSVIGNSVGAMPDNYPYEQMGYNIPKPGFGVATKVANPTSASDFENIIAVPGGMQYTVNVGDNGKMGAALYLIDPDVNHHALQDGVTPSVGGVKVLNNASYTNVPNKWKVGSNYVSGSPYSNPYMGMMISEPLFLSLKTSNRYISDGILAADNRGNIHYVSMVNDNMNPPSPLSKSNWTIKTVGTLRSGTDDPIWSYSNPYGVCVGARGVSAPIWVGGGTANIGGLNNVVIENHEQMLFCFTLPKLSDLGGESPGLTSRGGDINRGSGRTGWTKLYPDDGPGGIDLDAGHDGWFIALTEENAEYFNEYATVKPIIVGGYMYAATFRQKKLTTGEGLCDIGSITGESRLYAVEMDTGKAARWSDDSKKYITFDGLKFTGFTHSKIGAVETLVITYSALDDFEASSSVDENIKREEETGLSRVQGFQENSAIQLILTSPSSAIRSPVTLNDGVVNYWHFIQPEPSNP
ncbi:MAG: hypothetical protein FWE55_00140 [Synergistaceae bacterium]|nr:hypothetical protein [Synergistaceae bacterium]